METENDWVADTETLKVIEGVLWQAINDYLTHDEGEELYEDVFNWIVSERMEEMFDFLCVCKYLNLNPDKVRLMMNDRKDRKRKLERKHRWLRDAEFCDFMTCCTIVE